MSDHSTLGGLVGTLGWSTGTPREDWTRQCPKFRGGNIVPQLSVVVKLVPNTNTNS